MCFGANLLCLSERRPDAGLDIGVIQGWHDLQQFEYMQGRGGIVLVNV